MHKKFNSLFDPIAFKSQSTEPPNAQMAINLLFQREELYCFMLIMNKRKLGEFSLLRHERCCSGYANQEQSNGVICRKQLVMIPGE